MCAEAPGLRAHAGLGHALHQHFKQRLGNFRPRRADKAGTASMARVAQQRELRNQQHAATDVRQRKVHLVVLILKYAQTCDL